ncbi:coenzyme F420-0:L-glutamate ligase [Variovorax sp. OV700]|uniref:coenzyme F420-0:L-glutamate ligase n=1 Tax=Variovorax sp. OV700 TaxID=1882826 RepID=UPI000885BCEF|nr:coenzyme F420-0:L-glutamate ligase [Variovorax sp. OV700]SDH84847.1 coenzyme F420-0:L-glutamate ligase / coenzyme F420-1:gamma-L-glutamate ligase [Variovorax sp. OV700]
MTAVSIFSIPGVPDITSGDDLARILGDAIHSHAGGIAQNDILVVAQKVVSKAEGLFVDLDEVAPSAEAKELADQLGKDARYVEVVLRQSSRVVKHFWHPSQKEGTLICEHVSGHISANAGVDRSNVGGENRVLLLPRDPDACARRLHQSLQARFACAFGLVISDTFGRPWRLGQVNVAIGAAGLPALRTEIGNLDAHGRELSVTEPAFGDEIAAASGLVIGKASRTPLVMIRGLHWHEKPGCAGDLLRNQSEDMFK